MGFKCDLDTLPSFDIFHATLIDLLPLLCGLNDLLNVLQRDTDDTVHISNDIIPRVYSYGRECFLGIFWVNLKGNVDRGWTCEGRLTQSRATPSENRIPEGIMFLDVPTAAGDDYTECLADLCTCRHEATPDRVLRSYEGQVVNSRALIRKRRD